MKKRGDEEFPKWPQFSDDEVDAVARVLRSGKVNYWTGNEAREFEREFACEVGTKHAIAVANGSVSLELALIALGVREGDEVITTPRSFIASASCALMRRATPVFVDIDLNSQNITSEAIEGAITKRTKAIIVVHLAGWPCEMEGITELARLRRIPVIEDCAQAHGAMYKERPVGGFGAFGSFSFCQDKIITTGGEGGMLVVNDEALWARAWAYKDHGKSFAAVYEREQPAGYRWLHESFGTNWRLTEMQAALGRLQLRKLATWVERRRQNAKRLIEGFSDVECLRVPVPPEHVYHSYYKFYAFLDCARLKRGWSRDRVAAEIAARGVPCFVGSCSETYLEKAFDGHPSRPAERLSCARILGETSLMFLVHPTLTRVHIERTVEVVCDVLREAARRNRARSSLSIDSVEA